MVILDKSSFMKAISIAVFTLGSIMMPTTSPSGVTIVRQSVFRSCIAMAASYRVASVFKTGDIVRLLVLLGSNDPRFCKVLPLPSLVIPVKYSWKLILPDPSTSIKSKICFASHMLTSSFGEILCSSCLNSFSEISPLLSWLISSKLCFSFKEICPTLRVSVSTVTAPFGFPSASTATTPRTTKCKLSDCAAVMALPASSRLVLIGSWTTLGTMALTMGILFKTRHELLGSQEGPDDLGLKK
mmetsp:Transcript_34920/g.58691  ORF Transcript_34920/g.58691 Transcript_34920/m.58691 type:complete len:242 (+) Transcript_34920:390-1115(+)